MSTSVKMWVVIHDDAKGVRTYFNTSRQEWHVNLMFADFVEYDTAVVWRDYLTQFMTVDEALGYNIRPVTITVGEN